MISLIVAVSENNVIGGQNKLVWSLPADLKHFRTITTGHPIIMGRKTFESIGRPLPGRENIVITRSPERLEGKGVEATSSLEEALKIAAKNEPDEIFIIGGGEIYRLSMSIADYIYFTRVHASFEGDVTFPDLSTDDWEEVSREHHEPDEKNKYPYTFIKYKRISKHRP